MSKKILIIDDSEKMRVALRDWLSGEFPGTCFLAAQDGEEGVAFARESQPQVVLMDIKMGAMNGIEATRQIKAAVPGSQVVILTVYDAPEYRAEAAAAGASGFVTKDKASTELIPVMRSLLAQPGTTAETES